jgi:hypothetical protein
MRNRDLPARDGEVSRTLGLIFLEPRQGDSLSGPREVAACVLGTCRDNREGITPGISRVE